MHRPIHEAVALLGVMAALLSGCSGVTGREPAEPEPWFTVIRRRPDLQTLSNVALAIRIEETGFPWHVKDRRTGIEFVLTPPGRFRRGCPDDEEDALPFEKPAHDVTLTKPFYLGVTEVTDAEFRRFRPSHDSGRRDSEDETLPAVNVSWEDAKAFCAAYGFRLPTEAEWEYAYRAGTQSVFPWGDDRLGGEGFGNVNDTSLSGLESEYAKSCFPWNDGHRFMAPVATFRPNGLGLHDMLGNAREWCADWFSGDEYRRYAAGVVDPSGPKRGIRKVLRGSSFRFLARYGRSGSRGHRSPTTKRIDIGFRVARNP